MGQRGPKPKEPRDVVAVSVRLDRVLHRRTRQLALDKGTSLNRELTEALQRYVEDETRRMMPAAVGQ